MLEDPAELHEVVDVLNRRRFTMEEWSLVLSLRRRSVMVSTNLTRFS